MQPCTRFLFVSNLCINGIYLPESVIFPIRCFPSLLCSQQAFSRLDDARRYICAATQLPVKLLELRLAHYSQSCEAQVRVVYIRRGTCCFGESSNFVLRDASQVVAGRLSVEERGLFKKL